MAKVGAEVIEFNAVDTTAQVRGNLWSGLFDKLGRFVKDGNDLVIRNPVIKYNNFYKKIEIGFDDRTVVDYALIKLRCETITG